MECHPTCPLPSALTSSGSGVRRPLITDEPWDCYHLESLLPLKETYRENTEFGFLLRHYWIPATILTFRQSLHTTFLDGRVEQCNLEIERKMARCRSNECLWREKIRTLPSPVSGEGPKTSPRLLGEGQGVREQSEMLCSYDCYEQTYATAKPILFAPPTAEQKTEARRQALYRLPMLCPPGPVPIGFSWYGKVGDDYMNYRLDAEERVGETSVLVVRREGRYTTWVSRESARSASGSSTENPIEASVCDANAVRVVTERKGVTLFAWNRATVLEDRFTDRIVEAQGHLASIVGTATQVVTRLIRSCPEKLAGPAMKKPENKQAAECVGCKCED